MILIPALQSTKALIGKELHATDGTIGHVKDFYFDDQTWIVRYLAVNTGSWLTGRQVVLASDSFTDIGEDPEVLKVALTKKQIEESPSIDSLFPISRRCEKEYDSFCGWPNYWGGMGMAYAEVTPPQSYPLREIVFRAQEGEAHLRSTQAVHGYHIRASDGNLGHVDSFLFGSQDWQVHRIVVKTGLWNFGKEIHLSPEEIRFINYEESFVEVRLSRGCLADRHIK